jgi:predicted nuclease with TOPRIM domain
MANITNPKIEKVKGEISKIKAKIAEYQSKIAECQTKLRELERQKTKLEDSEIVSMFRNNSEKSNEDIFAMLREEHQTESDAAVEPPASQDKEEKSNGNYEK